MFSQVECCWVLKLFLYKSLFKKCNTENVTLGHIVKCVVYILTNLQIIITLVLVTDLSHLNIELSYLSLTSERLKF